MTVYMRWVPDTSDRVSVVLEPRVGSIGVVVQTDKYGQQLLDFGRDSERGMSRRYWCRPQDLTLVKERDYLIQQAMEALGAEANEEA